MQNTVIEYLNESSPAWLLPAWSASSGAVWMKIGLPEERKGTIDPNLDHCWFEWGGVYALTSEAPSVDITAEKLVQNFQTRKGKWDDTKQD